MFCKEKEAIFYGAGEWARHYHKQLKVLNRLTPICFAESNKDRIGKSIMTKDGATYDIYSLEDAIIRYPQAKIFISQEYPLKWATMHMLVADMGVEYEKILGYRETEYRLGCFKLESRYRLTHDDVQADAICMTFCCSPDVLRSALPSLVIDDSYNEGNIDNYIEKAIEFHKEVVGDLNNEYGKYCRGCSLLEMNWFPKDYCISELEHTFLATCNLKCHNCVQKQDSDTANNKKAYSFFKTVEYFNKKYYEEPNLFDMPCCVQFASGEFTVQKDLDETFKELLKSPFKTFLTSNCTIYRKEIEELLANRLATIVTSPDAGTRETFLKIKKVDLFEQLRKNLIQYGKYGKGLFLKYIFFEGINDNKDDIDGFLQLVKDVNCSRVLLTVDLLSKGTYGNKQAYSENLYEKCCYFVEKAREMGLSVIIRNFEMSFELVDILVSKYENCVRENVK